MKFVKLVLCTIAVAAALATNAGAHSLKSPRHPTLDQLADYQERVLQHDSHVLRWYRRARPLTTLPACSAPLTIIWKHATGRSHKCLTPNARDRARRSLAFHKAQAQWVSRELRETRQAILERADRNWFWALQYVAQVFPDQKPWVQDCSSSEGASPDGLRSPGFVRNREGSGASGPMQFMSSTFYGNVDGAIAEVRRRGHSFLGKWRSWSSYAGQGLTAAWMRWRGTDHGQWTGARC